MSILSKVLSTTFRYILKATVNSLAKDALKATEKAEKIDTWKEKTKVSKKFKNKRKKLTAVETKLKATKERLHNEEYQALKKVSDKVVTLKAKAKQAEAQSAKLSELL